MFSLPKDTRKYPVLFECDRFLLDRLSSIPFPVSAAESAKSLIGEKLGFGKIHSKHPDTLVQKLCGLSKDIPSLTAVEAGVSLTSRVFPSAGLKHVQLLILAVWQTWQIPQRKESSRATGVDGAETTVD